MKTDKEIIDWMAHNTTLHKTVEVFYVVDGYKAVLCYDDCPVLGVHGKDYRETLTKLIENSENK